ncbi:protein kinase domain-containing protein [Microbispora oryzae]|uniref:protein kinase domain-containing protein n=1 Tax=Microbispora oryzae TaxID=2806554 RepID=UPI0027DD3854|nr:protein kinase [Microbispora oryzae]
MALQDGDPARLGPYEVVDRLGEGGQGVVYLGRGPAGEPVAVKLLHARFTADPEARERFLREVSLARRVARFCTASVLHADMAGNQPYIVSEYVPGPSLRQLVEREGPRRGAALERLAISTVTALAAIHRAGITHRDFKPANVLMGAEGPVVIDFGVARALDSPQTTGTGAAVGTPAYFAPELLSGGAATAAADVFAWGVTMVFAATGTPAFGADSIPSVMARILNSPPDLGALSGPLRDIVAACLSKDPARRPSAEEVLARLTGSAPATGPVPSPGRRRPSRTALIVSGVAAAGVLTTAVVLVAVRPPSVVSTLPAAGTGAIAASAPAGTAPPGSPAPSSPRSSEAVPRNAGHRTPSTGTEGTGNAGSTGDTGPRSGATAPPSSHRTRTPATPSRTPVSTGTSGGGSTAPATTPSPKPSPEPTRKATAPAPKPNPYSAAGVCGSGFKVIDSHSYGAATTYLLYNASSGKNCVVTLSKYVIPAKIKMSAVLKVKGGASTADSGQYTAYAGPLRLAATRTCVIWGGGYGSATWTSGWSHCG